MGRLFPHGLTGIIFDCDGVMIDSRAANAIFYNKVLAALGLPPLTPEQDAYTFMATARQALEYIVPRLPGISRACPRPRHAPGRAYQQNCGRDAKGSGLFGVALLF